MEKLNILWTTTNRDTIKNMIAMYSIGAIRHGWIDNVNVIIWGASAEIAGNDEEIQGLIKDMMQAGVTFQACLACADKYGVAPILERLGMEVKYMGPDLTNILDKNEKLLSL